MQTQLEQSTLLGGGHTAQLGHLGQVGFGAAAGWVLHFFYRSASCWRTSGHVGWFSSTYLLTSPTFCEIKVEDSFVIWSAFFVVSVISTDVWSPMRFQVKSWRNLLSDWTTWTPRMIANRSVAKLNILNFHLIAWLNFCYESICFFSCSVSVILSESSCFLIVAVDVYF